MTEAPNTVVEHDLLKRKILFTPLRTKEALHNWISVFLGVDLPDCVVAKQGPNPSNSSPMDMIWEIYSACIENRTAEIPRVMAYAARDSFKCVEKGTLLLTKDKGLIPIEEVSLGQTLWSGKNWRVVTDWVHDGVKESRTLDLANGARLTTSPIHRVWAWRAGSLPDWIKVSELEPSDLVRWDTESKFSIASKEAEDDFYNGYLCGILSGDGCLRFMDEGHVTLSNIDNHVLSFWKEFCLKTAGRPPTQSKTRPCDWRINSVAVCAYLRNLGITDGYSWEKDIPSSSMKSAKAIAGFVSGVFDTDGTFDSRGGVTFAMTAEKLLRKMQIALCAMGVDSRFKQTPFYPHHGQKHRVYKLTVNQNSIPDLMNAGVKMTAVKARSFCPAKTSDAHDSIARGHLKSLLDKLPSVGGRWRSQKVRKPKTGYDSVTRSKINNLVSYGESNKSLTASEASFWREANSTRWVPVDKVSDGEADFYDLTVDEDHSYWSGGIVSHNTLGASILEILAVLHLDRDVGHMAAIQSQSDNCMKYVKSFMDRPILRDFKIGDNVEKTTIVRYYNKETSESVSEKEWSTFSDGEALRWVRIERFIKIVICTIKGANCVDPTTLIRMADGTDKAAWEVSAGDVVKGFDTVDRQFVNNRVGFVSTTVKPRMKISFDAGGSVTVTEDHLCFSNSGWVYARNLAVGDRFFTASDEGIADGEYIARDLDEHLPRSNPVSVLVGTLLGDGCLAWPRNKGAGKGPRYHLSHCEKQLPYLQRTLKMLEPLGLSFSISERNGIHQAVSKVSSCLIPYYNIFYGSGKKVVTDEVLRLVDEEALAYWFMDDGRGNPEVVGSVKDHCYSLATCGFSLEENERIVKWMKSRFDLNARISYVSNGKKKYPIVELSLESSRKMTELIQVYVVPCLRYKLVPPSGALMRRCIDCDSEVVSGRRGRFSRCELCPNPNSRTGRAKQALFKSRFSHRVSKIEFLEPARCVDIHIDTDKKSRQNFVANRSLLLHNSLHVPFLVVDEVDIADVKAYKQARFIPSVFEGKEPITLLISTRKSGTGLVQQELDNASKSGLKVLHWNVLDVTAKCPTERHRPDLPKLPVYRSDDTLRAISREEFATLTEDDQEKYTQDEAYHGCLKNCKLYAICQGQLADKQESTSTALRTINNTQNRFVENTADSEDLVKAEMLCWSPSKDGLIYYRYTPEVHRLSAAKIAEKITGEPFPDYFTKGQLYELCIQREMQFYVGMDWGYTHNFVSALGVRDGARMFIIECYSLGDMDDVQKVDFCARRFRDLKPIIYADPESPASVKLFKKNGFSMREWSKGKGSVQGGIEAVRAKLWPVMGREPQLFFLSNDQGVDLLCERMGKYHWIVDRAGRLTDEPDDKNDDEMDALRYLIMNVFVKNGKITVAKDIDLDKVRALTDSGQVQYSPSSWMSEIISEKLGGIDQDGQVLDTTPIKGKKSGFIWNL